MTAFKNDRPQFQSFTGSYQAFEQPPAKSIKWWLLVQKEKNLKGIYSICAYITCHMSAPTLKEGITTWLLSKIIHLRINHLLAVVRRLVSHLLSQ
jgi:hypothetical protein